MKALCLIFLSFCTSSFLYSPCNPQYFEVSPENYPDPVNEVVITEIMADPDPVVSLPDAEYLELFNRSDAPVALGGWRLFFGDRACYLPEITLAPLAYMLICESGREIEFTGCGTVAGLPRMPAVVNTGGMLTLVSASGDVVSSVEYSDNWYDTPSKAKGGWSLEMIDTDNPCGKAENWSESTDPAGGTPCRRNSVSALNPDTERPRLLRAAMQGNSSVILHFSESMDSASISNPSLYSVSRGMLHPLRSDPVEPQYRSIILSWNEPFSSAAVYSVMAMYSLHDCAGNLLAANPSVPFAFSQQAESLDLVINEILFDATPQRGEFIELYNRSPKVIDLASLVLEMLNEETGLPKKQFALANSAFLLFPESYAVLTRNARELPNNTGYACAEKILEQKASFILPDAGGCVALRNDAGIEIDRVCYSNRMHSPFYETTAGVSLERIQSDGPSDDPQNWSSASTTAGCATAGYKNSQSGFDGDESVSVYVSPSLFSPDNDGTDDAALVVIQLGNPGFTGNVVVFDAAGKHIKTLARSEIIGSETVFTWDGAKNDGKQADMGIYVIFIELFNSRGEIKNYRKVVTLTRKF